MQKYWIFQYRTALNQDLSEALSKGVNFILEKWHAHGTPLDAEWKLIRNQFLFIHLSDASAHASGCSIDRLTREIQTLNTELNLEVCGAEHIFYEDTEMNQFMPVHFTEIESALLHGKIKSESLIADTSLGGTENAQALLRPLQETWLKKYMV